MLSDCGLFLAAITLLILLTTVVFVLAADPLINAAIHVAVILLAAFCAHLSHLETPEPLEQAAEVV